MSAEEALKYGLIDKIIKKNGVLRKIRGRINPWGNTVKRIN